MALPVGVTTATVTAGVPVSHTGAPVKAFLSIEPSVFLVHTATGTPLVDFLEELSINEGVAGQFTLPHTDQAGFQDENGNAYTNWYYTARISYSTPSKSKNKPPKIKVFQLATGQTVVDLDRLPSGAPALPYTAPIATLTSVAGLTGAVTGDELLATPAIKTALSRFAPHESAQFAAAGVNAIIARGRYSCTIQAIGDSTNSGQVRWPRELANEFADHFPDHTVWWQPWDDTTQKYADPTVVQLGPLGERSVSFDGTAGRQYAVGAAQNVAAITGDLDVSAKLAATTWANGGTGQVIAGQYRAGGNNRGWQFYLKPDGKPGFIWSEDGIATKLAECNTAVPYANGATGWLRCTHDVDTGTGNDVKFYTSPDGNTWTQLGATIASVGVTSHHNTTTPFTIAHLGSDVGGNVGSNWFTGKLFIVRVRNGLQGHTILPELPEDWDSVDNGSDGTIFNGSPIIRMLIGAVGGTSSLHFNDPVRRVKLFAPNGQRLLFIGTGLNEGGQWSNFILNYFRTVLTDLKAVMPAVPIVMLGQNPTQPTGTYTNDYWAAQQEHVSALLLTLAATTTGVYGLDTFPAFTDRTVEVPDGQHPIGTGPVEQAARIFNAMFYPG